MTLLYTRAEFEFTRLASARLGGLAFKRRSCSSLRAARVVRARVGLMLTRLPAKRPWFTRVGLESARLPAGI